MDTLGVIPRYASSRSCVPLRSAPSEPCRGPGVSRIVPASGCPDPLGHRGGQVTSSWPWSPFVGAGGRGMRSLEPPGEIPNLLEAESRPRHVSPGSPRGGSVSAASTESATRARPPPTRPSPSTPSCAAGRAAPVDRFKIRPMVNARGVWSSLDDLPDDLDLDPVVAVGDPVPHPPARSPGGPRDATTRPRPARPGGRLALSIRPPAGSIDEERHPTTPRHPLTDVAGSRSFSRAGSHRLSGHHVR